VLNILFGDKLDIKLPKHANANSMYAFIGQALDNEGDARASRIHLDFSDLDFIDPVGVVILSNLIEYLRRCRVGGNMYGLNGAQSGGVRYLDDAGFFARYNKKPLVAASHARAGMLPLQLVESMEGTNYVFRKLVPWLSFQLGVTEAALGTLRVCLEEIFLNVADHSGTGVGCIAGQIFSKPEHQLHIAISDFGRGIPAQVRTVAPKLNDPQAVRLACQEGFTTKSNVRNRGAGLPNLIKIITAPGWGTVWIDSGFGNVSATRGNAGAKIVSRERADFYPGTLVRITINLNAVLASIAAVNESEDFEW
jgi:anti-sigma regulatory factor (Ser/Thr protein kinase)